MRLAMVGWLGLYGLALGTGANCAFASSLAPDQAFVQVGRARHATTLTAGAGWVWDWERPWAGGALGGHWEASIGRWASDMDTGPESKAWVTQLGLTPTLRWKPTGRRWYLEAGVGANLLLPLYRSENKRFSTAFNFGSHVAVGLLGGEWSDHELSLRIQHYSNAGIRKPNPGEDFVQLRYTRRL